jgi:hypothetical protein
MSLRLYTRFQVLHWIRGSSLDFRLSNVSEVVHNISGSPLYLRLFTRFQALQIDLSVFT